MVVVVVLLQVSVDSSKN